MRNYNKAIIIVAILLVGGGVGFFVFGVMSAGSIEDSFNFTYDPSSPDPIEGITFNVDIGSLIFQYNTSPTAYYAEIDVNMEITGWFMEDKTYLDFFYPSSNWWDDTTATFSLQVLPDVWFNPSHWFKSYNISIIIILRTDIVYDIKASTSTGSVEMNVPNDVFLNGTSLSSSTGNVKFVTGGNNKIMGLVRLASSTGKIEAYPSNTNFSMGVHGSTSTGSVTLNFTNCVTDGNVIGKTSTGNVVFKSYNMLYLSDSLINLETSTGNVNADLYQHITMGANVTGAWETSTGSVNVMYRDSLTNTDVRFIGSTGTGTFNYQAHATMEITGPDNNIYSTLNFGDGTYRYIFSLDTSTGNINADATSS